MADDLKSGAGPLLLAIESATRQASVALLQGDEVLAERMSSPGAHHAEQLLPLIDQMFDDMGRSLGEVEAFGVSIGPGSFTSLRIGLATVKGLAFQSKCPVAAVSTLSTLAVTAAESLGPGLFVPALDARRGELYASVVAVDEAGEPARVVPEGVYTPVELVRCLPAEFDSIQWVGEGSALLAVEIRHACDARPDLDAKARMAQASKVGVEVDPVTWPMARSVGRLAGAAIRRGEARLAEELVPRYVRRAEAEVQRTSERFEV